MSLMERGGWVALGLLEGEVLLETPWPRRALGRGLAAWPRTNHPPPSQASLVYITQVDEIPAATCCPERSWVYEHEAPKEAMAGGESIQ